VFKKNKRFFSKEEELKITEITRLTSVLVVNEVVVDGEGGGGGSAVKMAS